MKTWNLTDAIAIIKQMENLAPAYGCHVGLTGSVLYGGDGEKKDLDIILYRIRQSQKIDFEGFFHALNLYVGIIKESGFGFCYKATYQGKKIDFLCPEEDGGEYQEPKDPLDIAISNRDSD